MKEGSKKSRVVDRVLNVIAIIVAILAIIIAISTITSAKKGYNDMFGVAGVNVLSDSMKGEKDDSFNKDDLIYIKIIKDDAKKDLKVGDVITFYDSNLNNQLNTHRIVDIYTADEKVYYTTQGDNSQYTDGVSVTDSEIVGKYNGSRIPAVGSIIKFIKSPVGFGVLVLLPCFLIVVYALFKVIVNYKKFNEEKLVKAVEGARVLSDDEKETLKKQYLKELESSNSTGDTQPPQPQDFEDKK